MNLPGMAWAFAVTLLMQKLLIPVAGRLDLLDYPAGRKDHPHPTPVIGGIAMLIGVLVATAYSLQLFDPAVFAFLLAATLLVSSACSMTSSISTGACVSIPRFSPRSPIFSNPR